LAVIGIWHKGKPEVLFSGETSGNSLCGYFWLRSYFRPS